MATATSTTPFTAKTYSVGRFLAGVALGDVTGDGLIDLVTVDAEDHAVRLLLNQGAGQFTPGTVAFSTIAGSHGRHPRALAVGDVTGNGKLDVVTANADGSVSVLLGIGAGKFSQAVTYPTGATLCATVVLADVTGTGTLDVVTTNPGVLSSYHRGQDPIFGPGTVSVLLNDGAGHFSTYQHYAVGSRSPSTHYSYPVAVAAGRFQGTGASDIVTANLGDASISVLLNHNDGSGMFATAMTSTVPPDPAAIIVGAFTSTTSQDVLTVHHDASMNLLRDTGNGRLASASSTPVATGIGHAATAVASDFYGDGFLSVAFPNQVGTSLALAHGHGDGSFSMTVMPLSGTTGSIAAAVAGDLNGDGMPDLALVSVLAGKNGMQSSVIVLTNTLGHP